MELFLGVLAGVGLAAACGFRIFVPPLVLSIAALSGHIHLGPGFSWMGTWPALIAFAVATALEVAAYYVPWMDNLLDALATPAAAVAGTVVTASCIGDMSPFLRWTLAAVAGGGVASAVQVLTVKARALSSFFTLGAGNPVLASGEAAGSLVVSLASIVLPVLVLGILVLFGVLAWWVLSDSMEGPPTAGP